MIQLIGIKSKCNIEIRQKFSIVSAKLEYNLKTIKGDIGDVVILSTCNRTEVYIDSNFSKRDLVNRVFEKLGWEEGLVQYSFYTSGRDAVKHLMEVSCGFHSKILGEDQILGQIKTAYYSALKAGTVKGSLHKMFQTAISCGKKFKSICKMYEIPVSVPSIVVNKARNIGLKRYMIIGFGEIGKLVLKYLSSSTANIIYVVVRNISKIPSIMKEYRMVKFITFKERKDYYDDIDCIISCTSAPHIIIGKDELPSKKNMTIFDLAVPRDVSKNVMELPLVRLYDIDSISKIDEENKNIRKRKMMKYRYIIDNYIDDFMKWQLLSELSPEIQRIKEKGSDICSRRINTFINKKHTKDNEELMKTMIKSTARVYIDRAIEVLKEEKLNGKENECRDIIDRIFCNKNYD